MIPASFDYVRAASLRDVLTAIAAGDGTKVIAGGHSLLPMMRFRLTEPSRLVDLADIAELRGVSDQQGGARIGAMTTYRDLLASDLLRERFPIIGECTDGIGDLQVRNRGTIGGSVAHADPNSDMPAVMLVLDATFKLTSTRGSRSVAAREFFKAPFSTALAKDELLTDIILPPLPKGAGSAYVSLDQAASGYAMAAAAAVIAKNRGTVSQAAVATTGVMEISRLIATDQLVGSKGESEVVGRVASAAVERVEVNGDIHAPADYRRHLATVVIRRAIQKALERAT